MKRILLIVSFTVIGLNYVHAQDATSNTFMWFDLEAGIGYQPEYDNPSAGKFGVQIQFNQNLISVNTVSVGSNFTFHSATSILYGRVITAQDSKFLGAISTGISYVSDSQTEFGLFGGRSGSTSSFQGMGLPVQINFQYPVFKYFAVASTIFGNINQDQNFGCITVGFQVGKFWN